MPDFLSLIPMVQKSSVCQVCCHYCSHRHRVTTITTPSFSFLSILPLNQHTSLWLTRKQALGWDQAFLKAGAEQNRQEGGRKKRGDKDGWWSQEDRAGLVPHWTDSKNQPMVKIGHAEHPATSSVIGVKNSWSQESNTATLKPFPTCSTEGSSYINTERQNIMASWR